MNDETHREFLIEQLRGLGEEYGVCTEAAEVIEELAAENARLRAALPATE